MNTDHPVKILWLIPSRNAPWYHQLAKALAYAFPEMTLTVLSFVPRQAEECIKSESNGVQYHSYKTERVIVDLLTLRTKRIRKIRKVLKRYYDYDLVHIHGTEHQFQAATARFDKPMVVSIQGILTEYFPFESWSNWKQKFSWWIGAMYERKYLNLSGDFFCRTHWDKAFVKSHHPKAQIHHCWEMIREEFFYEHVSHQSDNLAFMGGLNEIKGISLMIQAFNILRQKGHYTLTIIGSASQVGLDQLLNKTGASHLKPFIELAGQLDAKEIAAVYSRSVILVHPSKIDNSPNSICEAQLCGLPVIATNVGGVSSLIEDGQTGFFTENDPLILSQKIELVLSDVQLRKKVSANAQVLARERHDPVKILKKTMEVYRKLIKS